MPYSMNELIEEARRLGTNPSGKQLPSRLRSISERQFSQTYGFSPANLRAMASNARAFGETAQTPATRPKPAARQMSVASQPQIHPDAIKFFNALGRALSGPGSRTPGARLESAGRPLPKRGGTIFDERAGAQRTREAMMRPGAGGRIGAVSDWIRENMTGGVSEAADTRARGIFAPPAEHLRTALNRPQASENIGAAGDTLSDFVAELISRIKYGQ